MADPLVSIICITYNHEPYIRQCLDGFMMQKTNFPFEVLIHDDASTDKTADIIREYKARYPDVIKPIYQTENQYSKGVKIGLTYLYPNAKGKYIAECEGDDYWTDPLKLQKQVDFLENNQSYALCCHQYVIVKGTEINRSVNWLRDVTSFNLDFYVNSKRWLTQPLTVLFRRDILDINNYSLYHDSKDVTLFYYLLKYGDGYLMPDEMGVYRLHDGGTFSQLLHSEKLLGNLKTIFGIASVERSEIAAKYLKGTIEDSLPYIGLKFIINNIDLFVKSSKILAPYYGRSYILSMIARKVRSFVCRHVN